MSICVACGVCVICVVCAKCQLGLQLVVLSKWIENSKVDRSGSKVDRDLKWIKNQSGSKVDRE